MTPLGAAGTVDVTAFSFTVNTPAAARSWRTTLGDALYLASDGPCEPLQVVDANVSITPNGTNPVGTTHTFTGHVNVNDGTGFVNAPAGTTITFTIDSGPGSFVGGVSSCTTVARHRQLHRDDHLGRCRRHRRQRALDGDASPASR